MKWYEKQKELYLKKEQEDKNQSAKSDDEATVYERFTDEAVDNPEPAYEAAVEPKQEESKPFPSYLDQAVAHPCTSIGSGTILHGNIETEDDLEIHGTIEGDIICNRHLTITGQIKGNIQCDTIDIDAAVIKGDIRCISNLKISAHSSIEGNIEAGELLSGGHIKGDIHASGGATFSEQAAVSGNIRAKDIEIRRGAIIQGNIQIDQDIYFESFD